MCFCACMYFQCLINFSSTQIYAQVHFFLFFVNRISKLKLTHAAAGSCNYI